MTARPLWYEEVQWRYAGAEMLLRRMRCLGANLRAVAITIAIGIATDGEP